MTHAIPFLRAFFAAAGDIIPGRIDHKAKMSCTLALVEAVNNAIFHAHKKDPEKWIDLSLDFSEAKIEMAVHDSGRGFILNGRDVPALEKSHGRGLFLIRSLMNEVTYERNKSNVLKMVYYL